MYKDGKNPRSKIFSFSSGIPFLSFSEVVTLLNYSSTLKTKESDVGLLPNPSKFIRLLSSQYIYLFLVKNSVVGGRISAILCVINSQCFEKNQGNLKIIVLD